MIVSSANGREYTVNVQDAAIINQLDVETITSQLLSDGFAVVNDVSSKFNRDALQRVLFSRTKKGYPDLCHHNAFLQLRQDPDLVACFERILLRKRLNVTFENAIHWKTGNEIYLKFLRWSTSCASRLIGDYSHGRTGRYVCISLTTYQVGRFAIATWRFRYLGCAFCIQLFPSETKKSTNRTRMLCNADFLHSSSAMWVHSQTKLQHKNCVQYTSARSVRTRCTLFSFHFDGVNQTSFYCTWRKPVWIWG
jgi:hypothetical protein